MNREVTLSADDSHPEIPDDITAVKNPPRDFFADPADGEELDLCTIPLRDYFAGQALTGYMAAHADPTASLPAAAAIAAKAYRYADAMMAERRKGVADGHGR